MPKAGKVVLVGAGPGAPDLLTLRAVQRIGDADVIVYDRLIQREVLTLAKPAAEKIYMGKPPGHHVLQDEIQALLVQKAREGKTVIRLKGGDPFLFGRGGEEVEYLAEHGIPFEVVPGVSSCLSAPLSAGIAVTHRECSSSVVIVTGHCAQGNDERVDWQAVAKIGTSVFSWACTISSRSRKSCSPRAVRRPRPAAMIQMAYWDGERVVTGHLPALPPRSAREH